jgi:uncharacterized lipoprotein YmbA
VTPDSTFASTADSTLNSTLDSTLDSSTLPERRRMRPAMRRSACAFMYVCAAAALAGCATPLPDHFYTLSGIDLENPSPGTAGTIAPPAPGYYLEIPAVNVPQQVSRPQMVIETAPGSIELKEHERWSAPLADEIRLAVSSDLTRSLGAIDVYRTAHTGSAPVYRVSMNVEQFVSAPGRYAALDVVWSVRALPDGAVLTCRSALREPVGTGYADLVAGHKRVLHRLSAAIAATIGQFSAARPTAPRAATPQPACPTSN